MRVVYSPVHLAHEVVTETQMGVQMPANEVAARAERIRGALEADGGFELVAPTEHGDGPITAVHDPGLARLPAGRVGGDPPRPASRTRSSRPRPSRRRSCTRACPTRSGASRRTSPAARATGRSTRPRRSWPGPMRRRGPRSTSRSRRSTSCWAARPLPTACAGRPGITRRARCTAATATSTTPRSPPRPSPAGRGSRSRSSTSTTTTATAREQIFWRRGDVLYVSLHAHPDRQYPYFLGWPDEAAKGEGEGANLNIPLPAGLSDEGYLEALDRGLDRIADHAGSVARRLARLRHLRARPAGRLRPDDRRSTTRSGAGSRRPAGGW